MASTTLSGSSLGSANTLAEMGGLCPEASTITSPALISVNASLTRITPLASLNSDLYSAIF